MLDVEYTKSFMKDYKREKRSSYSKTLDQDIKAALDFLQNEQPLPTGYSDHAGKGEWQGCRECHLKPDLLLIYQTFSPTLYLIRLGSHARLFQRKT